MASNLAKDILETIQYGIDIAMKPYKNQDIIVTVIGIDEYSGKYICQKNGKQYLLYDGVGIQINVGDTVWVHVPNSDIKKAYICAKANGNAISK